MVKNVHHIFPEWSIQVPDFVQTVQTFEEIQFILIKKRKVPTFGIFIKKCWQLILYHDQMILD